MKLKNKEMITDMCSLLMVFHAHKIMEQGSIINKFEHIDLDKQAIEYYNKISNSNIRYLDIIFG